MTFQTFNHRVLAIFLLMIASVSIHAQQPTQADMLNNVAKLKRIEAMQPDSIQPKYQLALQSLSFSVTYPHAPQTECHRHSSPLEDPEESSIMKAQVPVIASSS